MRENLIGYLLDALEPAEQELVEARLSHDPQCRRELELLKRSLASLAIDKGHFEPPMGLAARTEEFVAVQTKVRPAPAVTTVPSRWSMADLVVAAGIFLAATLLFWPAMQQSRFAARVTQCQKNLGELGMAFDKHSQFHPKQLPSGEASGRLSGAGMYAVLLQERKMLPRVHVIICPATPLADQAGQFRVPSLAELREAQQDQLVRLRKQMGGSYGYSLGFVLNNKYHPPADLRRPRRALMADVPSTSDSHASANHDGRGQNVLFEDLHVEFLEGCQPPGCKDHIFVNDRGEIRAGLHPEDTVIAPSDVSPWHEPMQVEAAP
jgi:hypothetical protein